jgi:hypothetical protein
MCVIFDLSDPFLDAPLWVKSGHSWKAAKKKEAALFDQE